MKLLIDGNNVVRYITRGPATQSDMNVFLGKLRRYSRFMGHEIVVVFDGGDSMYKYQLFHHGLCLWYSGFRETADDVIKQLLPAYNPDEVLLITDDRQLNYEAQECGTVSVSSAFFYARMQEKEDGHTQQLVYEKNRITKTSLDTNQELDAIMQTLSGSIPSKSETCDDKNDMVKGKKSSKIERRLQALMSKL